MAKKFRRMLALILALILCLSQMVTPAFAVTEDITNEAGEVIGQKTTEEIKDSADQVIGTSEEIVYNEQKTGEEEVTKTDSEGNEVKGTETTFESSGSATSDTTVGEEADPETVGEGSAEAPEFSDDLADYTAGTPSEPEDVTPEDANPVEEKEPEDISNPGEFTDENGETVTEESFTPPEDSETEPVDFPVNLVYKVDENGNPVMVEMPKQATNEDGTPMVDENGNPVYVQKTNEDGTPMVDENGNPVYETILVPVLEEANLEMQAPEVTFTESGEPISSNQDLDGVGLGTEKPWGEDQTPSWGHNKGGHEYVALQVGEGEDAKLVYMAYSNSKGWLSWGTYDEESIAIGSVDESGNVVITAEIHNKDDNGGSATGNAVVEAAKGVEVSERGTHTETDPWGREYEVADSTCTLTITLTPTDLEKLGFDLEDGDQIKGIKFNESSTNTDGDSFDNMIFNMGSLIVIRDGQEVEVTITKEYEPTTDTKYIDITEPGQILDAKYLDEENYELEKIYDKVDENGEPVEGAKLLGFKATPVNGTVNTDTVVNDDEELTSVTTYLTQQVADPRAEADGGLESKFQDADGNAIAADEGSTDEKKTYTVTGDDGTVYIKTVTKAPRYEQTGVNADGTPIYATDENGNYIVAKDENGNEIMDDVIAYTTKSYAFGEPQIQGEGVAAELTEEEAAKYADDPGTPSAPVYLEATDKVDELLAKKGSTDPETGDQILEVSAGAPQRQILADGSEGRYYQIVTITGIDKDGKTFTEYRTVYGDVEITTTYTYYNNVEKKVYTYTRTATETVDTTIFTKTSTVTTNTWTKTATETTYETKETEYFMLEDPETDELKFEYNGVMYAVEDMNDAEDNAFNYDDIKAAGITVNSKVADKDAYNTDVSVQIKKGLFVGTYAVIKDANGNELGRFSMEDNVNGFVEGVYGLTGATEMADSADGETTTYTFKGIELANGVKITISLTSDEVPKTGTYALDGGMPMTLAADAAENGTDNVELKFDMDFTAKAPKLQTYTETTTEKTGEKTINLTASKSTDSSVTKMQIQQVTTEYTDTKTTFQISGTVTEGSTTQTLTEVIWNRIAKLFVEKEEEELPPPPPTPPVVIVEEEEDDDVPGGGGVPMLLNLDDEPVPMEETPEEILEELTSIMDEEVPLADAAETGDLTFLWGAMGLISLSGSKVLSRKKKEEDEE